MTESALLNSSQAETQALETTIAALKATPKGRDELAREMRLLAEHCARYPRDVQGFWNLFKGHQPAGTVDEFRETIERFLDLLAGRIRVTTQLRDLAEEIAARQGQPAVDEGVFGNTINELQGMRDRIADFWSWMNAPRPPLDRRMVEESRASRVRGESEDARDLFARLQSGGNLIED